MIGQMTIWDLMPTEEEEALDPLREVALMASPYWTTSWDDETCPCICEDCYYNWMPEDDFFCGKGERREDG